MWCSFTQRDVYSLRKFQTNREAKPNTEAEVGTSWPSPVGRLGAWIYQSSYGTGSKAQWLGLMHSVLCGDKLAQSATRTPAGKSGSFSRGTTQCCACKEVNVFWSRFPLWPWLPSCFLSAFQVLASPSPAYEIFWLELICMAIIPCLMTHLSSLLICLVYSQLLRLLAFQFVPKPDWHNKAVTKLPISFSFFWLAFEQITSGVRANLTSLDWWLFLIMKWCQPVRLNENCPLADWCSLAFWHSCGDSVDQPHDCTFRLEVWYYYFFSIWMKKKLFSCC